MNSVVGRAKALILAPQQEWQVIAAEQTDTKSLILSYSAYLAVIPAVSTLIAVSLVMRIVGTFVPVHVGFLPLLLHSIVSYALTLGSVWAFGKIIQTLAPQFGGVNDELSAMKLAAYSPTAAWVASVFMIIPVLGILSLLGLYSLYLLYTGASAVIGVPKEKSFIFTVAVAVAGALFLIVIRLVASALFPLI